MFFTAFDWMMPAAPPWCRFIYGGAFVHQPKLFKDFLKEKPNHYWVRAH